MSILDKFGRKQHRGSTDLADKLDIVVTEVGGKAFVSGLYWQTLESVQDYMGEARQLARKPEMAGMSIVAIRERVMSDRDVAVQAGFAPHRAGADKGNYSMATAVAGALGDNFVAALPRGD